MKLEAQHRSRRLLKRKGQHLAGLEMRAKADLPTWAAVLGFDPRH
jgi:hypothetical protein